MNYKTKGGKRSTKRAARPTHYGFTKSAATATAAPKTTYPKYQPVSDEVTVYGAKKFRTPHTANEFFGEQGSAIPAYVLDIDGTLTDFGSSAKKSTLDWCDKIMKDDPKAVFLVVTARDHGSFGYTSSFNWLMAHFPHPFIGPFARPTDDPRYASEFKRELAQGFEDMGLYWIKGAADDNEFVIKMWKQWAIDHFEDPKDFQLLECDYYSHYGTWRSGLASKGYTPHYGASAGKSYKPTGTTVGGKTGGNTPAAKDEHWDSKTQKWVPNHMDGKTWVAGAYDHDQKRYVPGYWVDDSVAGKHRKAGESRYPEAPLTEDPAWAQYFAKREDAGAYIGADDALDEVLDQVDVELEGYSLVKSDLKAMVRRNYPGYSDAELDDMSMDELRENAGITTSPAWDQHDAGLFSDAVLGVQNPDMAATPEAREAAINYRLDMEEELYAIDDTLTQAEIASMDLGVIEDAVAHWYAKNPTTGYVQPKREDYDLPEEDVRKAGDPANTEPLATVDLNKLLGELDEAQTFTGEARQVAVAEALDRALQDKVGHAS